jgi:radical SAM superfamily enzyme YgiQ (UPF0313 family)
MPHYEGVVIRPPSEADSLILQVTLGCSDNRCIFCPAYKEKIFRIKDPAAVEKEMQEAAAAFPGTRKLFLADGDALVMPQEQLSAIAERANAYFPRLQRIGVYGSIKSLEGKSPADLAELRRLKLGIVYLGFETGDDEVYRRIRKYGSPDGNVAACRKVAAAGIKTNVTVILGLGGKALSLPHAVHTARLLNTARPDQIAALTLMIAPGTPLCTMLDRGEFTPLRDFEFLEELRTLIAHLDDDLRCLFFANHASNYYPISARFPKDKSVVLQGLSEAIGGRDHRSLTPEYRRGL